MSFTADKTSCSIIQLVVLVHLSYQRRLKIAKRPPRKNSTRISNNEARGEIINLIFSKKRIYHGIKISRF